MSKKKHIKIGFIMHGIGRFKNDWKLEGRDKGDSISLKLYADQAVTAEKGKFDFLLIADSLFIDKNSNPHYVNRFEPITILSALSTLTKNIGLVCTVSVTYSEPFNIARQISSLDNISGGRAGWNVVTSWMSKSAANFSKSEHLPHATRYRLAAEYLNVVQGLWDSWEDDAFIADKERGLFFDTNKLHALDHKGEFFQVRGPLNIKRSNQGQPVIFQAGLSEEGRDFAASYAEVLFSQASSIEDARAYYRDVKYRAKIFGRDSNLPYVMPGIAPIIANTPEEAEYEYKKITDLEPIEPGIAVLRRTFGEYDIRETDLDKKFPNAPGKILIGREEAAAMILADALKNDLTLRQVLQRIVVPRGSFVGTATEVADTMEYWVQRKGADGFIIFESLPGQLNLFVDSVIPILQNRELFRYKYNGNTLRENLGLKVPQNRNIRS